MVKIIGKSSWPSVALLQNAVAHIDSDIQINWGYSVQGALNANYKNGLQQLQAFGESGVTKPIFTDSLERAILGESEGHEVWGRKLNHTRGNDIVPKGHRLWRHRDFWVVKVPDVIEEWRMHVFQGRVIARALKVQTGPSTRRLPVRSRSNGWTMRHDVEPPHGLRNFAKSMVSAVGYDFGACDILRTGSGFVALEVNKAPGLLSNYTLSAYVKAIERMEV